jgi:hypothetical protein
MQGQQTIYVKDLTHFIIENIHTRKGIEQRGSLIYVAHLLPIEFHFGHIFWVFISKLSLSPYICAAHK